MTTDTTVLLLPPCWAWLASLAWVAGWAYAQAQLSYFLAQCQEPGQLLAFWRVWLDRNFGPAAPRPRWFYKPLGGCLLCFNVWLAALVFGLLLVLAPPEPVRLWPLHGLAFVACSNAWLRARLARMGL